MAFSSPHRTTASKSASSHPTTGYNPLVNCKLWCFPHNAGAKTSEAAGAAGIDMERPIPHNENPENLTFTDCSVDWACLKRWAGYIERWLTDRYEYRFHFVFLQEFISTQESLQLLHDICGKWHMVPYITSVGRFHVCILVDAVMVEYTEETPYQSTGFVYTRYSPYYTIGWHGLKFLLVNVHAPHGQEETIRRSHANLLENLEKIWDH